MPSPNSFFRPILIFFLTAIPCGQLYGQLSDERVPAPSELLPAAEVESIDGRTRSQLDRLAAHLRQQQWDAAVDLIQDLADRHAAELVAASADDDPFQRFVPMREHLAVLSTDPAATELRQAYRARIDTTAEKLLEDGIARRDRQPLGEIVERYFPSRHTDAALLALGELALGRGDYNSARWHWQRTDPSLTPFSATADSHTRRIPNWLQSSAAGAEFGDSATPGHPSPPALASVPDSRIPLPDVWARLVLTSALEGNLRRAKSELDTLRSRFPNARGRLAGLETDYALVLGTIVDQAANWPRPDSPEDWLTFAGNSARNQISDRVDVSARPMWRAALEPLPVTTPARIGTDRPEIRVAERSDELCPYYPIIVDDKVFVADAMGIKGFELPTGQPLDWTRQWSSQRDVSTETADAWRIPTIPEGVPRFTLSAESDCLFVRLGNPLTYVTDPARARLSSRLVGINLRADGRLQFPPIVPPENGWAFDGAPLAAGGRVYCVLRRSALVAELHVACYVHGELQWRRRICAAEMAAGEVDAITHTLLTHAEDTIYINTNLGIVAALATTDGSIRWMSRYPRTAVTPKNLLHRRWHVLRDMNPCLYEQGTLFVAPTDMDGIMALDASTGQLLWVTDVPPGILDVVHLLAVTPDHLIASGHRVWWFDRYTGRLSGTVAENPFPREIGPTLRGMGRGLLAGNHVLWPARSRNLNRIYVLDHRTGTMVRQPVQLSAFDVESGNLALAHQTLLVAGPRELVALRAAELNPEDK